MAATNYLVIGPPRVDKLAYVEGLLTKPSKAIRLDPRKLDSAQSMKELCKSILGKSYSSGETPFKNFEILREELRGSTMEITIIIDHLEAYVETTSHQHFLYQLFDLSHDTTAKITVYAISSVPFVLDLFEKRVKSRFAHSVINVESRRIDEHEEGVINDLKALYGEVDTSLTSVVVSSNSAVNESSRLVTTIETLGIDVNSALRLTFDDEVYISMKRLPRYQLALLYTISRLLKDKDKASATLHEIYKATSLMKSASSDPVKLEKMAPHMIDGWLHQLADVGLLTEIKRQGGLMKKYRPVLRRDHLVTYIRNNNETWLNNFLN